MPREGAERGCQKGYCVGAEGTECAESAESAEGAEGAEGAEDAEGAEIESAGRALDFGFDGRLRAGTGLSSTSSSSTRKPVIVSIATVSRR